MIITGDCLDAMPDLADGTVDAIVTDPPYGLGFMGKKWDALPPGLAWADECLRVLKPGGHLLAFGGTRTYHRLACAIEDAGFEIRDCLAWMYGSGFPKSHNLNGDHQGWGTALKPAHEPIVLARKPLAGTVAANVLAHGTGAINVDGCRIERIPDKPGNVTPHVNGNGLTHRAMTRDPIDYVAPSGRWPANVLLDSEAAALLDAQTGTLTSGSGQRRPTEWQSINAYGFSQRPNGASDYERDGDSGGASRFFYVAKASSKERNAGLDGFEAKGRTDDGYGSIQTPIIDRATPRENWTPHAVRNTHPTVKPIDLMRWLVRLVTPPAGLVLDPFAGSGTTGIACALEGMDFLGMEREAQYADIARARIQWWSRQGRAAAWLGKAV